MLITVAIATYNRCQSLALTLEAVSNQSVLDGVEVEILVVDNNSTDGTRATVEAFVARDARFRYVFEGRQGVSPARNRALADARGEWLLFTDDDIEPATDWITSAAIAIRDHPEWVLSGGRVLARNQHLFPAWLTSGHFSPLALLDRGPQARPLSASTGMIVSANMLINKAQARLIGPFSEKLGRVGDTILGSMEDEDYTHRFLDAGLSCFYNPSLVVYTDVESKRLRPFYHWRWHFGHGHHWAVRRLPSFEKSHLTAFSVPGHVYRQGLVNLLKLPFAIFSPCNLMVHLNLICWSAGFIRERFRQFWQRE